MRHIRISLIYFYTTGTSAHTLKNKRVIQHLKGPRSDSVFIVLHLPYYPAGANMFKVLNPAG